jgi:hypothetical protein
MKKNVRYLVREKKFGGFLFSSENEKECIDFIQNELRNRNEKDGYDEYWHNAQIIIIKEETIETEYLYVDDYE